METPTKELWIGLIEAYIFVVFQRMLLQKDVSYVFMCNTNIPSSFYGKKWLVIWNAQSCF